jgi:hypothetical protein
VPLFGNAFAQTSDVVKVFRPLTTAEEALAEGLLEQASVKMLLKGREFGIDVQALGASDPLIDQAIKVAVVNADRRVLMNPKGQRQWQETRGPFNEGGTNDTTISSGQLYLDAADLADIFPANTGRKIRVLRLKPGLR